jgi:hypothetical protein
LIKFASTANHVTIEKKTQEPAHIAAAHKTTSPISTAAAAIKRR